MWSRFRQEPVSRVIRLLQYAGSQYDLQQITYFGNQSLDYFQTLYAEIVYHVEQIEIGVFFKKLSGCCKMLQKNMICSKYYNLETNALITSKLGTQYWIVMWRRFRQVFLQKLSGCCNIQQSYYLLQITLFCSKLKIFVKEIFLNQFRMPNKPCIPSLEVIITIFLNLYNLLQKILFCSILHQTIIF